MLKRNTKIISIFAGMAIILVGFQNCGEKLDLSAQLGESTIASTPGVSFVADLAPGNENQPYQLSVLVNKIEDYTIAWEKDGVLIDGATTENLDFTNLEFTDEGEYEAIATAGSVSYRSGAQPLRVIQDPAEPLIVGAESFPRFAPLFYLIANGLNTAGQQALAEDYCQQKYGAQAGYITHALAAAINFDRYAIWSNVGYNATTCNVGNAVVIRQEGTHFCLIDQAVNVNITRFSSISCNRYPDYVEP